MSWSGQVQITGANSGSVFLYGHNGGLSAPDAVVAGLRSSRSTDAGYLARYILGVWSEGYDLDSGFAISPHPYITDAPLIEVDTEKQRVRLDEPMWLSGATSPWVRYPMFTSVVDHVPYDPEDYERYDKLHEMIKKKVRDGLDKSHQVA